MNKLLILLFTIFVLFLISCKTTTIVVVPIPNVNIPIYPPQEVSSNKMSYNTNYHNYFAYSHFIEISNGRKNYE